MPKTVFIVAAHPDDEILGVGGTAAWHVARGDEVVTAILAEGSTSRDLKRDRDSRKSELQALKDAAIAAAGELGMGPPRFGDLPDNRMDTCDLLDVVKVVEAMMEDINPDTVYTHHGSDLNIDHRIIHQAVLTACRPLPGMKPCAVYTFETVSSTEWGSHDIGLAFRPQLYVDISNTLEHKLKALSHYPMEMRPAPHARSIESVEALARLRGSQIGVAAAEAFMVAREIAN